MVIGRNHSCMHEQSLGYCVQRHLFASSGFRVNTNFKHIHFTSSQGTFLQTKIFLYSPAFPKDLVALQTSSWACNLSMPLTRTRLTLVFTSVSGQTRWPTTSSRHKNGSRFVDLYRVVQDLERGTGTYRNVLQRACLKFQESWLTTTTMSARSCDGFSRHCGC